MKKILVLNHFPIVYPPTSGGTLRYFHIYHKLSRYYDITLLSQTYGHKEGLFNYSSTFREYKIKKDPLYKQIIQDLQHNELIYEFALIINIELSKHPTLYKKHFDTLYQTNDLIIHESPFLLEYDQFFGLDHKPRIYNSHNHEYMLAEQIWKNQKARNYLPIIYELEKKLVKYADLVFSTSETERNHFISTYNAIPNKIKLAPNGIQPDEWLPHKKEPNVKPVAFFIGAEYPPNTEALEYIVHHLADRCPEIEFVIAGGCCNPYLKLNKSNVKLLGKVHNKTKLKLLAGADMAINPIFTGAGVNLKTLEFLSAGLPLFSTQCGVRGLNLIDKKHYIHAEKANFADKINQYCHDIKLLKEISSNGQKYINKHYSWDDIAKSIYTEIEKTIAQ